MPRSIMATYQGSWGVIRIIIQKLYSYDALDQLTDRTKQRQLQWEEYQLRPDRTNSIPNDLIRFDPDWMKKRFKNDKSLSERKAFILFKQICDPAGITFNPIRT